MYRSVQIEEKQQISINRINARSRIIYSGSSNYFYDIFGNLSQDQWFDDVAGDFFRYDYDPMNRLTRVDYDYDGDGAGLTAVADYRYDAQGRL